MRGIEMTFTATVTEHLGKLALAGSATRPGLELAPLQAVDAVQWDIGSPGSEPGGRDRKSDGASQERWRRRFLEIREFEVDRA
jgi:hypothetical protein